MATAALAVWTVHGAGARVATVTGPDRSSEILRDGRDAPHVYAGSLEEVGWGFGWARLRNHGDEILDLHGLARGRAPESWGPDHLASDQLIWTMGVPAAGKAALAARLPELRACLQAAAHGMNAFATAHPEAPSDERERGLAPAAVGLGTVRCLHLCLGVLEGLAEIQSVPLEHTLAAQIRAIAPALAGREAERLVPRSISAGAGGPAGAGSDLERATRLAVTIKLPSGRGAHGPLWAPADWHTTDRGMLHLILGHHAQDEALAHETLALRCEALDRLAIALVEHRAMEGDELAALLADVTPTPQADTAEAVKAPVPDGFGELTMSWAESKVGGGCGPARTHGS